MRFASFVLLAAAVACGGSSSSSSDAPPPSPAPPAQRGPVSIAFTVAGAAATTEQWGEPFTVHASGFLPGEPITLHATTNVNGVLYASDAVFAADLQGVVDTSLAAPTSGSYSGVDVDGLVWSMKATKTAPGDLPAWSVRVEARSGDEALANATLARWYQKQSVVRTEVDDNGLVGVFFADPTAGKKPAIVAFGGSEGGITTGEYLAMYWASRGYAALGLAYFGTTGVPTYLEEIPLEYFDKAFTWLDGRPEADATKLCVMGGSRGGELALLLGATFPRIGCVVADVPSAVAWGAPQSLTSETASWTYRGKPIPWVPYVTNAQPEDWRAPDGTVASSYRKSFHDSIAQATPDQLAAATFHVENTSGPILMTGGDDDQVWPSCELQKIAMDRLASTGHASKYADEATCYAASGHASGWTPGASTFDDLTAAVPGDVLALGGTAAGVAKAQRDSFTRVTAFLAKALK